MSLPTWLVDLSIAALLIALISALALLLDILLRKRQMMPVMKWVWPVTALYMGPFALWAYYSMQIAPDVSQQGQQHQKMQQPFWQIVFKGVTHCGAGCTLGDIIGEWAIFLFGVTLAGIALWPEYIVDYVLAYALGIIFQYFAIAPMRHLGVKDGVIAAIKADTLSLTAFEVGLFGWMALTTFVFFHNQLHPDSPVYWFMMQIGMVIGFATSYPMNWWLISKGIKEKM
jgi:putative flippase GtrA